MNIVRMDARTRLRIAKLLVFAQFFLLGLLSVLVILARNKTVHSYLIFEALLIVAGVSIILVAAQNLKPALKISPIPKANSPLILIGIYRYVRHPMYLGVILIGVGLAGYSGGLLGWILEGLLILTLNAKANFEDALIREVHPEALHFQMHTSKIIPCVGNTCRSNCAFSSKPSENYLDDSTN